tara:strand:+ start:1097 stop:1807 length:711 start_codon:yes stop_codon:yes gene_type:complete
MNWKIDAIKHINECLPNESCGLLAIVNGVEKYFPCKNLAESKHEYFIIDPDDWVVAEDSGQLTAIVHSHPNNTENPSENDRASCEYLGLPWYIYGLETKNWFYLLPKSYKKSDLIGRKFIWGVYDCWSLITDWYKQVKNIDIPYWNRPKTLKDFISNPEFEHALPKLNFVKQDDKNNIQVGDVLLFKTCTGGLDHVAVYIGDQTILNHNIKHLSCRAIFDLECQKALSAVYRYEIN